MRTADRELNYEIGDRAAGKHVRFQIPAWRERRRISPANRTSPVLRCNADEGSGTGRLGVWGPSLPAASSETLSNPAKLFPSALLRNAITVSEDAASNE